MSTTNSTPGGSVALPPRPDRETGQPRPPRAPAAWAGGKAHPETDPRRRPSPPDGQGPVLEWYRDSARHTRGVVLTAFGLMVVVMTLIAGGFSWMTDWVFWVIVLFLPLVMLRSSRRGWMAAGADWFAAHTGWVKLYQLTTVELEGNALSPRLYLTDDEGRVAHAELRHMQTNPRLWDLVHNGVLHSVHTRDVQINTAAQAQVVELGDTANLVRQMHETLDAPSSRVDAAAETQGWRRNARWCFTAAKTVMAIIAVLTLSLGFTGVVLVVIVIPYALLAGWGVTTAAEALPWIPELKVLLGAVAVVPPPFLVAGVLHVQGRILGPVIRRIWRWANPE